MAAIASAGAAPAQAAPWHVLTTFGRSGVAGLPVRERLREPPNQGAPSPPERYRSLLVPGPQGSVFAGGYAKSRPGAFLISRISSTGRLVKRFGRGGVSTVPAVRWVKQAPPRMLALPGGSVLIVGIDRADRLVVVRVNALGQPDRSFGHNGVARYKVPNAHGFSIVTAAVLEPDGEILAAYQKELPQPYSSSPRVPEGQGNGAIQLVRLLSSGALDRSFGVDGFLTASGEKVGLIEGESGTVGACAETLAASGSLLVAYEGFALEELSPAGTVLSGFGNDPTQASGGLATSFETKNAYHFCNGLFALACGGVEGVSGAQLTRLTAAGTPEPTFGTAGSTRFGVAPEAAAIASSGETFAIGRSGRALVLMGILANGQGDPALGGLAGRRFALELQRPAGSVPGEEEQPTWELLPLPGGLCIRIGEDLVRLES